MKNDFQDRIDEYILGRMSAEERFQFEAEVGSDEAKKKQLEFTENVKRAITSREEKLALLRDMKAEYKRERLYSAPAMGATGTDDYMQSPAPVFTRNKFRNRMRLWTWVSGIAAVVVIGLFIAVPIYNNMMYDVDSPSEIIRDDSDVIFDPDASIPVDSVANDTIVCDTINTTIRDEDE